MSFNLGSALKSLAPTLATMLGGPLAGGAVAAIEGALGLAPGAGVSGISQLLTTGALTPDMIEKLKECELTQATLMSQQKIDLVKLNLDHSAALAADDVADRTSARSMQIATKDWTPDVLAWLIILGAAGSAYFVLTGQVAAATKDPTTAALVGSVVGYLFSEAKAVTAFFFGSSVGSKDKDATLAEIAKS